MGGAKSAHNQGLATAFWIWWWWVSALGDLLGRLVGIVETLLTGAHANSEATADRVPVRIVHQRNTERAKTQQVFEYAVSVVWTPVSPERPFEQVGLGFCEEPTPQHGTVVSTNAKSGEVVVEDDRVHATDRLVDEVENVAGVRISLIPGASETVSRSHGHTRKQDCGQANSNRHTDPTLSTTRDWLHRAQVSSHPPFLSPASAGESDVVRTPVRIRKNPNQALLRAMLLSPIPFVNRGFPALLNPSHRPPVEQGEQ